MIVDGHLDIAYNAIAEGRPFEGPPARGYALSRDALVKAGVGLVFPTLFVAPAKGAFTDAGPLACRTAGEAALLAQAQVGYYRSVGLDLLRDAAAVRAYRRAWRPGRLAGVLLMESAQPIASPADLPRWLDLGVRVIGPAWSRTPYCGGTGAPGGFTARGRELLAEMQRAGVVLDLTHLADRAVRDALHLYRGPVVATHVGARALNPGQRQLEDSVAREVASRGGVVGVSFYAGHLRPRGAAGLDDLIRHLVHFAEVTGGPRHVALGSDLDGGFDAAHSAVRRLSRLADLDRRLRGRFSAAETRGIMGENWLDFLERALPGGRGTA